MRSLHLPRRRVASPGRSLTYLMLFWAALIGLVWWTAH